MHHKYLIALSLIFVSFTLFNCSRPEQTHWGEVPKEQQPTDQSREFMNRLAPQLTKVCMSPSDSDINKIEALIDSGIAKKYFPNALQRYRIQMLCDPKVGRYDEALRRIDALDTTSVKGYMGPQYINALRLRVKALKSYSVGAYDAYFNYNKEGLHLMQTYIDRYKDDIHHRLSKSLQAETSNNPWTALFQYYLFYAVVDPRGCETDINWYISHFPTKKEEFKQIKAMVFNDDPLRFYCF